MRTIFVAMLALAACGDDPAPTATYHVSWTVADTGAPAAPTCASYRIGNIWITATDTVTGDSFSQIALCTAGAIDLEAGLGSHTITLDATGEFAESAGHAEITGALTKANTTVTLASVAIQTAAPKTMTHATWMLRAAGAATTCAALSSSGVQVTNTPMGQSPLVDIWDCTRPNATIEVPYGPYTVKAEVLGSTGLVIGSSAVISVDAARGTVATGVTIDVP